MEDKYQLLITKTFYCPNTSDYAIMDTPIIVKDIKFDGFNNISSAIAINYGYNEVDTELKIINTVFYRKTKEDWIQVLSHVQSWTIVDIPPALINDYLSIPKSYKEDGSLIYSKEKSEFKSKIINYFRDAIFPHLTESNWTIANQPQSVEDKIEQCKAMETYEKLIPLFRLEDADSIFIFGQVKDSSTWCKKDRYIYGININTSDILSWGCADCYELNPSNIDKFIIYYKEWEWAGIVMWYCEELNVRPQAAVVRLLKEKGQWDILKERMAKLKPNHDEIKEIVETVETKKE